MAFLQLADLASAKALIAFDADINKFSSSNETPYDIAVQKCPAIADILTGIGGLDGYELQIYGSLRENSEWKEPEFERMFDPAVMCMDHHGVHTDGSGAGEEGDRGGAGEALEDAEGEKMQSIPEGVCMYIYPEHSSSIHLWFEVLCIDYIAHYNGE